VMTVEVAMVMTLTICGNGGNAGKMIMLEVLITVMLVNRQGWWMMMTEAANRDCDGGDVSEDGGVGDDVETMRSDQISIFLLLFLVDCI